MVFPATINDVFSELSIVIIVVLAVSLLMRILRQPLLIGYIIAGVLVGPLVLDIVHTHDTLDVFADFGVALLLFIVGLGLSPKIIKEVGKTSVLTGVLQVVFTSAVGWLIAKGLGYDNLPALYIAIALAFSSTIIVLKLLSDKKEHNRLYGRISIGFLLVQDICAALLLVAIPLINDDSLQTADIYELVGKGILALVGIWVMAAWILPKLKHFISTNQEFLFIFAIAWGFGIGALFHSNGFSLEVGALVAGVALASQPYVTEISARLRPLRDFFIILFFVHLGTVFELSVIGTVLPQALLLSLFVLIGNPIIVMIIMGLLGFTKKTGFKAGLVVAQISEFSLIFIALAVTNLDPVLKSQVTGLVTLVALITIAASSYMIIYADRLYNMLEPILGIFERKNVQDKRIGQQPQLLLIGYTNGGEQFTKAFKELKKPYLVIDYNPRIIEQLEHANLPHTYGDISDLELVEELGLEKIELLISTINEFKTNYFLAEYLQKRNLPAIFICSADSPDQAKKLYQAGVSYVMLPHYIGGQKILHFIKKAGINKEAFTKFRNEHLLHIDNLSNTKTPSHAEGKKHRLGEAIIRKVKSHRQKNSDK